MTTTTKQNAPGQGGVFGKAKGLYFRAHSATVWGPVQVYELLKTQFVAAHPDCLQYEYESACQRFARRAGL
jgi:hypothetical protein